MPDRMSTEPGIEINAVRLEALAAQMVAVKDKVEDVGHKLDRMSTQMAEQTVEMKHIQESRKDQGKRLGDLEKDVNELKGLRKVILALTTVALVLLGAAAKSYFGGKDERTTKGTSQLQEVLDDDGGRRGLGGWTVRPGP